MFLVNMFWHKIYMPFLIPEGAAEKDTDALECASNDPRCIQIIGGDGACSNLGHIGRRFIWPSIIPGTREGGILRPNRRSICYRWNQRVRRNITHNFCMKVKLSVLIENEGWRIQLSIADFRKSSQKIQLCSNFNFGPSSQIRIMLFDEINIPEILTFSVIPSKEFPGKRKFPLRKYSKRWIGSSILKLT